ncbi:MAG: STAS domain-containing protein [Planctomycetota bacterium]
MNAASSKREQNFFVVKLPVQVDIQSAETLEEQIVAQANSEGPNVIADMEGCTYLSSAGIRFLMVVSNRARKNGGEMLLTGVGRNVLELLTICGLDRRFRIFPNVGEAVAAITV